MCAPDSRSVFYLDGGTGHVMQVPIDGGPARAITDLAAAGFFGVSPDGHTVAFATIDHAAGHEEKIALAPTDKDAAPRLLEFQRPRANNLIHFSARRQVADLRGSRKWRRQLVAADTRRFAGQAVNVIQSGAHLGLSLVPRWQQTRVGAGAHRLRRGADAQPATLAI